MSLLPSLIDELEALKGEVANALFAARGMQVHATGADARVDTTADANLSPVDLEVKLAKAVDELSLEVRQFIRECSAIKRESGAPQSQKTIERGGQDDYSPVKKNHQQSTNGGGFMSFFSGKSSTKSSSLTYKIHVGGSLLGADRDFLDFMVKTSKATPHRMKMTEKSYGNPDVMFILERAGSRIQRTMEEVIAKHRDLISLNTGVIIYRVGGIN